MPVATKLGPVDTRAIREFIDVTDEDNYEFSTKNVMYVRPEQTAQVKHNDEATLGTILELEFYGIDPKVTKLTFDRPVTLGVVYY